jgi:hypothetical protein
VSAKECIFQLEGVLEGNAYEAPYVPAVTLFHYDDDGKQVPGTDPQARAILYHHPGLLLWHRALMGLKPRKHSVPAPTCFPDGLDGSFKFRDYCDDGTWSVDDTDLPKNSYGWSTLRVEYWNDLFCDKINGTGLAESLTALDADRTEDRWIEPTVSHRDQSGKVIVKHPVCSWCARPFPNFICASCKRNFYCHTGCALNDWGRVTTQHSKLGNVTPRTPHCQTCVQDWRLAHEVLDDMNTKGEITLFPGFLGPLSVVNFRNHFDVLQWIHLQHWFSDYGHRFGGDFVENTVVTLRPSAMLYNPKIKLYLDSPVFEQAPNESVGQDLTVAEKLFRLRTSLTSRVCFPHTKDLPFPYPVHPSEFPSPPTPPQE